MKIPNQMKLTSISTDTDIKGIDLGMGFSIYLSLGHGFIWFIRGPISWLEVGLIKENQTSAFIYILVLIESKGSGVVTLIKIGLRVLHLGS